MSDEYFNCVPGGRWAASRLVQGRWLALIENDSLFDPGDAAAVLSELSIPFSGEALNRYFPIVLGKGRCPTRELLELFSRLPPGQGRETGV